MIYILAALPLIVLLGLMIGPRWGAHRAGPVSWLVGIVIAVLVFGLTPSVFIVSQARGALLAFYVLAVFFPALLLYYIVDQAGGIRAIAGALSARFSDRGLLMLLLAWAFSAFLEGLAGFGLPVAVVAPILVSFGAAPVTAVAAVAVGHAWSVTFGDMGVIFATLTSVSGMEESLLARPAALALGAACLLCGLAAARILGHPRLWTYAIGIGMAMAVAQYGIATAGLVPIAGMVAGLVGLGAGILVSPRRAASAVLSVGEKASVDRTRSVLCKPGAPLAAALFSYGALTLLLTVLALPGPLRSVLLPVVWQQQFPEVATSTGFFTAAGPGQAFRPFLHPGSAIFVMALVSAWVYRRIGLSQRGDLRAAARATLRSAGPASVGILSAVELSLLMEHTGMTQLLAEGCATALGSLFPLLSPWVGMLGAFATGSNNNSNVLFAPLQKTVAALINANPAILLAAQTAGGALGSMIAPAKLAVGCSTVGQKGREGDVLRRTLVYGLSIGLLTGVLALVAAR